VVDAARCDVEGATVEWRARSTGGAAEVTIERGCVTSTRGEGSAEVVAAVGALSARAMVTVVSEDQYRSLAAAHIEEEDASVESVAPGAGQSLGVSVSAEPSATRPPWWMAAIGVGALVGLLAVLGLLVRRGRSRTPPRWSDPPPPTPARPSPSEPVGRAEVAPAVVAPPAARAPGPESVVAPVAFTRRCPACGKLFGNSSEFCTEDGSRLAALSGEALPVAQAVATVVAAPRVRICPRCARRYEAPMDFCVDDGERLRDG